MSQLTKKAIVYSFIKLLNAKPLDKITVKDVVEDCGVNRNTFYYHFSDIRALTLYMMDMQTQNILGGDGEIDSWVDSFIEKAKFALENKRAVYHIYNSVSREAFEKYLNTVAYEVMSRFINKKAEGTNAKEEDKRLLIDFYRSALVGMICSWIEDGMKEEPEEAIHRLGKLLDGAITEALRISAEQ